MRIIYTIFTILFISSTSLFGQVRFIKPKKGKENTRKEKTTKQDNEPPNNTEKKINTFQPSETISSKYPSQLVFKNDSAYYLHITKRNGWYHGIGSEITIGQASHLNCYFKLSKKNNAGNWTFMQAYDGYGNLTTYHSIGTYLANQWDDEDKGLNQEWRENLKQVCQWEFIGNTEGDEVIQERGLDSEGNIMFAYSPVKIDKNTYTGTYTDAWGMPIYMRTDSLGSDLGYANFVQIVRDKEGYEVLYKYTDKNGTPQKNKDGGFMTEKAYDRIGNQIMEASLGITGKRIIDDYGNCGWECTFDSLGNVLTSRYYDADWNPIRMPGMRNAEKVYGYWYKYDDYGRLKKHGFLSNKGKCDVNLYGSYKIVYEYNEYGEQTRFVSYDSLGNKIAMDSLGIAEKICKMKNGFFTLIEIKDANGKLVNNADGICKKTWAFKGDVLTEQTNYETINGVVKKRYSFHQDSKGNEEYIWFYDNLIRLDSINDQGNEVFLGYFDLNYNPINKFGFHKRLTKYDYKKACYKETWYDKDGNLAIEDGNSYSSHESLIDSLQFKIQEKLYVNNEVSHCFVHVYDSSFTTILAQYDITPYGEHARVGWWDNLHYCVKANYDFKGNFLSFIGINEFGEQSYLSSKIDNTTYFYMGFDNGKNTYYDEDGNEIFMHNMDSLQSQLPKVFCIEVTDTSKAYSYGVKNGDIILGFGDWRINKDLKSNQNLLFIETILKNNESKNMIVLRHKPKDKKSEILTLQLPKGAISDLGFYPHQIFYTRKEKKRLLDCSEEYYFDFENKQHNVDRQLVLCIPDKGSVSDNDFYWNKSIKDPFLLLFCGKRPFLIRKLKMWSWKNNFLSYYTEALIDNEYNIGSIHFTKDLESVEIEDWTGANGLNVNRINVDEDTYNRITNLYENWSKRKHKRKN